MTCSYSYIVATCRGVGNFHRLLRRWTASIYKLVWRDIVVFFILYIAVTVTYRLYIKKRYDPQVDPHKTFIGLVCYCRDYQRTIPVSFILGFYVSNVVAKWWQVFQMIPWPDTVATIVSTDLLGNDERSRIMRRTIMRYVNLSFVMTMQLVSVPAKKRFPTEDSLVETGFLLPHELLIFKKIDEKCHYTVKFWVPIIWACAIVNRARREGRWPDDMTLNQAVKELDNFRGGLGGICVSDWLTIPLGYTQVVTIAIYVYFLAALFGQQFVADGHTLDLGLPWFTLIEFFFYMGWLKVAETMVNPWGEDDDDWDVHWFIDRHLQVSYMMVDGMRSIFPLPIKDLHWGKRGYLDLPYTRLAVREMAEPFFPSESCVPEVVPPEWCYGRWCRRPRAKTLALSGRKKRKVADSNCGCEFIQGR